MIYIAIIDDEEEFTKAYQKQLEEYFAQNGMEAEYSRFNDAKALFDGPGEYDLYFLDIEMPDMDGMKLAGMLREKYGEKPEIVFVTVREMAVYDAFSVDALGFIRKAYLTDDFERTMEKFLRKWEKKNHKIAFQTEIGPIYKPVTEIMYVEVYGHRLTLYCTNGTYIMRETMDNIRKILPKEDFIEPHRGYLVNCRFIDRIRGDLLTLDNGEKIPLSRRKKDEVREKHLRYLKSV